jgi:hypothetical protein
MSQSPLPTSAHRLHQVSQLSCKSTHHSAAISNMAEHVPSTKRSPSAPGHSA